MKIVKYIFLLLLLASIATTVFIATQDGKYNIKKEKVINVSRPVLYNYLNDYKNWENLGLFASADTTATFTYSERSSGSGAYISWSNESGDGKVQTKAVAVNDSISQKAILDNLDADVTWAFKDTLQSTRVSIRLSGKLTFAEKAYALLNGGIDNTIETSLDKGLVNLNNFLVKEIQKYSTEIVGVVNKKGTFYLGTNATLPLDDVNKKATTAFDKLLAFAVENKIKLAGKPFILFKSIDKIAKTANVSFSIPIGEEIYTTPGSDYVGAKLLPFNALKTTLRGDYSHLPNAWAAARKHMAQKSLQENITGQYIEIYTKSGAQTRRPSMLITDLYIPIGAPNVSVTVKDSLLPAPLRAKPANTTTANPATSSATGVNRTATTRTGTTGTKPANNPPRTTGNATGSATIKKPAAAATTKPATSQPKPNASGTGTAKPASTKPAPATVKPATSQPKPAPTTPVKTGTPANTTKKPGADDLNPPRA